MQRDKKGQRSPEDIFFIEALTRFVSGSLAMLGLLGILYVKSKKPEIEPTKETRNTVTTYTPREHERKIVTYQEHEIRVGESLTMIAEKYDVTVEDILNTNKEITDPDTIQIGEIIRIPHVETIILPKKELAEGLIRGIDISNYQGNIDWDKLEGAYKKGDISYIIIRICENINEKMEREFCLDERFEEYLSECNKRNIPYGIYAFSRGTNFEEIDTETNSLTNYINTQLNQTKVKNGKELDLTFNPSLPIYMDCFDDTNGAQYKMLLSGKYDQCVAIIEKWCTNIENAGYFAGVYLNNGHYNKLIQKPERENILNKYTLWVAEYPSTKQTEVKDCTELSVPFINSITTQQVSSSGKIDGIDGNVDVNISNRSLKEEVELFYRIKNEGALLSPNVKKRVH